MADWLMAETDVGQRIVVRTWDVQYFLCTNTVERTWLAMTQIDGNLISLQVPEETVENCLNG